MMGKYFHCGFKLFHKDMLILARITIITIRQFVLTIWLTTGPALHQEHLGEMLVIISSPCADIKDKQFINEILY